MYKHELNATYIRDNSAKQPMSNNIIGNSKSIVL